MGWISENAPNRALNKLKEATGLPEWVKIHSFRHGFASKLVDKGVNLRLVQALLGHQSITRTEVYTHLEEKQLRDAAQKGFLSS